MTLDGPADATDEPITQSQNDQYSDPLAQAKADVVVFLTVPIPGSALVENCSGTLIAPRVVLTARHCVRGTTDETNATGYYKATTAIVGVGSEARAPKAVVASGVIVPTFDAAVDSGNRNDTATDAALVILPEGSFVTSGLFIERPSFSVAVPMVDFAAGFAPANGGTYDTRQIGVFDFVSGPTATATGTSSYLTAIGPAQLRPGDSGGPLFFLRPDGTRDVRGVSSGTTTPGLNSYFADTSSVLLRDWIDVTAQDATRTSGWLSRHGKVGGDFWYGEADYTGACQASIDPDCDYWVGAHDDCPTTFNPDQLEAGDDGAGDACAAPDAAPDPPPDGNAGGS